MPAVPTDVVIALIWRHNSLLIGLRPEGKALPLLWEFPGGKCEPGETHAEALARECQEELGVRIAVGELVWGPVGAGSAEGPLRLLFYHAHLADADAEPQPLTTLALAWVTPGELGARPFCPADTELVAALSSGEVQPPQPSRQRA